jgi:hypothetical protein
MFHQMAATARDAFERGDEVLQVAIPLNQESGRVGPTGGETSSRRWDASDELNRIVRQGWSLLAASVVFVPSSEVSRDQFFLSGQQVAISGQVVGYYVFSRDETWRRDRTETTAPRRVEDRPVRTRTPNSEVTPLPPLQD